MPEVLLDVSATLPPAQKVVGPPGVMVGVAGSGLTVTTTGSDALLAQPSEVAVTVYVPAAVAAKV